MARILVVDDESASVRALCDVLPANGYDCVGYTNGREALAALEESAFDILLTDLMMPELDGVGLLTSALRVDPHLVGILMTGAGTIESAVQAMKAGALDYVLKPIKMAALLPVLARAAGVRRLRLENMELRDTVAIHELTQAMSHTLDPNVLLDKIAEAALAQFQADEVSVMLVDEDGSHLFVAAVRGESRDALLGTRVPIEEGVAGWVAANREPVVLHGVVEDARFRPLHQRPDIKSSLSMPMVTRSKLVGVLNVNCVRQRRPFALGQIKVLSIFSHAAAAGIDASRILEAQRRSDARYREVLQMAADAIISIDADQRIVVFNTGAEEVFGYRAEEAIGQSMEMLLPPEVAAMHGDSVRAFADEVNQWRAMGGRKHLVGRRKDGALINVEVGISCRSEGGKTLCTAVIRDVTDRVKQENRIASLTRIKTVLSGIGSAILRLRERSELFREACRIAVEDGGAGIAWIGTLDRDGMTVTPVAAAGIAPESEAATRPGSADAASPLGQGLVGRAIREKRVVYCRDLRLETGAGGPRRAEAIRRGYCSTVVLPLIIQDEAVGNLSIFVPTGEQWDDEGVKLFDQLAADISFGLEYIDKTEQLEAAKWALEQERGLLSERVIERTAELTRINKDLERAREDADQANRAKSAFLATMSHEIRTPMNGVLGMVEVLGHESLTEHQFDLVRTIRESATSLLGIIDDILDFSKIEAGRLEIERAPVSILDLTEAICASLLPVASRRGTSLSLFVSPEVPDYVLSDEVRLRQILYNLLGNAIKFSGGAASVRGKVGIRVQVEQGVSPKIRVEICDNGIGMDDWTISHLFTPFTQAEISTTRRFGGTGLGLAICKRLIDLMGGAIDVQSTPGLGSIFTVTLPFVVADGPGKEPLPDVTDIHCIVHAGPDVEASDLREYLKSAGIPTSIRTASGMHDVPPPLHCTVVHITDEGSMSMGAGASSAQRRDEASTGVGRPRRRRYRVEGIDVVFLDCDALRRRALIRAVAVAAGRLPSDAVHEAVRKPNVERRLAPLLIAEARMQGSLILVAEDDAVNQKVILRQLSLLGFTAEVANNGLEALRMWRQGGYGMLLTDLHMPEMDGYALTETIRREEGGLPRIPIIALTANALRGESARAEACGMDEFMTKPVKLEALRGMLDRWLPKRKALSTAEATGDGENDSHGPVIRLSVLKEFVGDDDAVVREFLSEYHRTVSEQAAQLKAAHDLGDMTQIGALSHKMKSSSRAVGALKLGDLCAELDTASKAGERLRVRELMTEFHTAYAEVEEQLSKLLGDTEKERT